MIVKETGAAVKRMGESAKPATPCMGQTTQAFIYGQRHHKRGELPRSLGRSGRRFDRMARNAGRGSAEKQATRFRSLFESPRGRCAAPSWFLDSECARTAKNTKPQGTGRVGNPLLRDKAREQEPQPGHCA